jgi:hypothetical protein
MRRRTAREAATTVVVAALVSLAGPAHAEPGEHIRAGDATITPSVSTGMEYHSNVYLADGGSNSPEVSAPSWVLSPRVAVDLAGKEILLDFGLGYKIQKYFDTNPNDPYEVENLDRYNQFDAKLSLNALPTGMFGVKVNDQFQVINTPAELQTAEAGTNANVVQTSNDAYGGLAIRPGSALEVDALGNVGVDIYTVPSELLSEDESSFNNRANYGPQVKASWRFLPKTAVTSSFSYSWIRWDRNFIEALGPEVEGSNTGLSLGKPDATSWRLLAGIRGQITAKMAVLGEAGFGQMYYDEQSVLDAAQGQVSANSTELQVKEDGTGDDFARDLTGFGEGLLVNLQLAYAPIKGQTITLGYKKDFQDAVFTNYVAYNDVYVRYEGLFANKFGATAQVDARFDGYHGEVTRNDLNLKTRLGGVYRATRFFSLGAGVGWAERACADTNCNDKEFYSTQYDDYSAEVGVTLTY